MTAEPESAPAREPGQSSGSYVYGILPADIELAADRTGVGDPPGTVYLVRAENVAALVSKVDLARPLGTPQDLALHKDILDASAAGVPVLPLRFGAVLATDDAVADELLAPHGDEFARALRDLDGRVEYVVHGRYAENAILAEVLAENPEATQLAEQIRGADPDATRDARIRLGELISNAVTAKREEDTRALGDMMAGRCSATAVREPTHEMDAINVAFLVDENQEKNLDQVVADLSETWAGRFELRLLGPMAAYDFVDGRATAC
jgi:hypothetical protein